METLTNNLIESLTVTLPAVLFLIVLFGGGEIFKRRNIDMGGDAPINKGLFSSSKYSMLFLWGAMIAQSWGLDLSVVRGPAALKWISLCLWLAGFTLIFAGRFGLGDSFRIGSPKENTRLKVHGVFRLSRNPMYVSLYLTILASVLYTLNPAVLLLGAYVVVVHHKIVLAEEAHLKQAFGGEYADYCLRVRRYV